MVCLFVCLQLDSDADENYEGIISIGGGGAGGSSLSVNTGSTTGRKDVGWPYYVRAWDEARWSTPPSISGTLPQCPLVLVGDAGPFTPPDNSVFNMPIVAIYITSVVLSPVPKSFSKPGSGAYVCVWNTLYCC